VLVVSSGGGQSYARLTVEMLESVIPYLSMKHLTTLQAPGTSGPDSARRDLALMKRAWSTGQRAVLGE
jgi:hypothetical protein